MKNFMLMLAVFLFAVCAIPGTVDAQELSVQQVVEMAALDVVLGTVSDAPDLAHATTIREFQDTAIIDPGDFGIQPTLVPTRAELAASPSDDRSPNNTAYYKTFPQVFTSATITLGGQNIPTIISATDPPGGTSICISKAHIQVTGVLTIDPVGFTPWTVDIY